MFRLIVFAAAVSLAPGAAFASELVITANFTEPSDLNSSLHCLARPFYVHWRLAMSTDWQRIRNDIRATPASIRRGLINAASWDFAGGC